MSASREGWQKFIEALSWSGKGRVEFLAYAIRDRSAPPFEAPALTHWPEGTTLARFALRDEFWPITVDLFELYAPQVPPEYETVLCVVLEGMMAQGALISWYMYEGAFGDIQTLFATPWQREQTYGIARPGHPPRLRLTPDAVSSDIWAAWLTDAEALLYRTYPSLRAAPSD